MSTPLVVVQVLLVVLLVVSSLETLRERPWWPQSPGRPVSRGPARGSSPRERRWIHGGLAAVVVANLLVLLTEGVDVVAWVAVGLLGGGIAAVIVGFARGPSDDDRRLFEELKDASDTGG
jgi:hypothetical protein